MSLKPQTGRVRKVETLPPDGTGSPPLLAPRWPLVPVLPTPVVDGQRWCVGASYDVAVEYFGVGGEWVAQPSKQYGLWEYDWEAHLGVTNAPPANSSYVEVPPPKQDISVGNWKYSFYITNLGGEVQYKSALSFYRGSTLILSLGTSPTLNAWSFYVTQNNGGYLDGGIIANDWTKRTFVEIEKASNILTVKINGFLKLNLNVTSWDATGITKTGLYSNDGIPSINISNVYVESNGVSVFNGNARSRLGLSLNENPITSVFSHKIKILAIGDSITSGVGSTGDNTGWFIYNGSKNLQLENHGIPAGTTDQFLSSLISFISYGEFDAVCYSPYTPNGMIPAFNLTQEVADIQKANFLLAYNHCKDRNIPIVVMELSPLDAYDSDEDLRRKEIIDYAYSLTGLKISLIDQISTMASPNRWRRDTVLTDDDLHPNNTGYGLMRTKFNTQLDMIADGLASRNHKQAWVPLA